MRTKGMRRREGHCLPASQSPAPAARDPAAARDACHAVRPYSSLPRLGTVHATVQAAAVRSSRQIVINIPFSIDGRKTERQDPRPAGR